MSTLSISYTQYVQNPNIELFGFNLVLCSNLSYLQTTKIINPLIVFKDLSIFIEITVSNKSKAN